MLQQSTADDYILATGKTNSVQQFLECIFEYADLDIKKHVVIDPRFYRPCEVPRLWGDASKANEDLGWYPEYAFRDLAIEMYKKDLERERNETRIIWSNI